MEVRSPRSRPIIGGSGIGSPSGVVRSAGVMAHEGVRLPNARVIPDILALDGVNLRGICGRKGGGALIVFSYISYKGCLG